MADYLGIPGLTKEKYDMLKANGLTDEQIRKMASPESWKLPISKSAKQAWQRQATYDIPERIVDDMLKKLVEQQQPSPGLQQYVQQNLQWAMGLKPETKINPQIASQIAEQVRARYAERGLFHSTPSAQAEAEALAKYYAGVRRRALEEQARIRQAQLGALAGAQALTEEQRRQLTQNLILALETNEDFLKARERLARYYMQKYNIDMQSALNEANRRMQEDLMKRARSGGLGSLFGGLFGGAVGFLVGGPVGALVGYGVGSATGKTIGEEVG